MYLLSIAYSIATLECTFLGIPVQPLQQRPSTTKRQILRTPLVLLHVLQDGSNCLIADSIPLYNSYKWWKEVIAFLIFHFSKLLGQNLQNL